MIAHLFMTWFTKYSHPEKKIPLKVLLFIDKYEPDKDDLVIQEL